MLARKRILVVDDSEEIRTSLAELLSMENYAVKLAQDGQAALEYLRSTAEMPDLIVLDLLMPGMSGYEFLERKRTEPGISGIPVIVMTANQNQDATTFASEVFLRKPFEVGVLLNLLTRFFEKTSP